MPKQQGKISVNDDILVIKRRTSKIAIPSRKRGSIAVTAETKVPSQLQAPAKQASQADMIRDGLLAAFQGASVAVVIAGILFALMYSLLKATTPDEYIEPT